MFIEIQRDVYQSKILPLLSDNSDIVLQAKKGLRWDSATSFDLDVTMLDWSEFDNLYNIAKRLEDRSLQVKIATVRNLLSDLESSKVPNLKAFAAGLIAYIATDRIDGWIYQAVNGQVVNPYLVKSIEYVSATGKDSPAFVSMKVEANIPSRSGSGSKETNLRFYADNISKGTVPEILYGVGYFHETQELKEIYLNGLSQFEHFQSQFGKQLWAQGTTKFQYSEGILRRSKVINDEGLISRKFKSSADATFWRERKEVDGFDDVPIHCYVHVFNLSTHENIWVHATGLTEYVYDESLRDKLVLPQDHRDLIDILVSDLDLLQDDIISGKSGGTTILCQGPPGLGKTLSAEAYSEIVKKPLYKVHSGQLGLTADNIQANLSDILQRSERWGAVLLLDEADVYIRQRGNDISHNAVVAEFLRTLEYFSGLLFMTTNRQNDVDDAILSRCIAVINYTTPNTEDAKRIWKVLSNQLGLDVSDDLIDILVAKYPNISGRDIKQLLKLAGRFAKGKQVALDIDLFRKCAQFRGI